MIIRQACCPLLVYHSISHMSIESFIIVLKKLTKRCFMVLMLNENIKRLRMARGLNQVEFARVMGVSKQCVSNWENDNVMPSIEMLIKIADFFNVTTDYILGRNERTYIDVTGLSDEQISHISLIVSDISQHI